MRLNNRLPILPSCESTCKQQRDLSRVAATENHLGGNPDKGPYIGDSRHSKYDLGLGRIGDSKGRALSGANPKGWRWLVPWHRQGSVRCRSSRRPDK
jgi:hypothetical protein